MARHIDADKLTDKLEELQFNASVMTPVMKIYNVIELVEDQSTADVVEVKDCEQCIHFGKHATEYPCSHCRNCYTDKFQPNYTRTPKERGEEK